MVVLGFNSNVLALGAERRLSQRVKETGASYERLSTGLRINRASDDASGLAIADQLKTNNRLYSAASRNINDGISMLNVIGGTLNNQANLLTRLLELAEQASSETVSTAQRKSLNAEYKALQKEFARLGDTTKFNGINLLQGGNFGNVSQILLQAGITGGLTSRLGISTADTSTHSGTYAEHANHGYFGGDSVTEEFLYDAWDGILLPVTIIDDTGKSRDLLIGFSDITDDGTSVSAITLVYQRVSDTGGVGALSGVGIVDDPNDDWVLGTFNGVAFDKATGQQTGFGYNGGATFDLFFEDVNVSALDAKADLAGFNFNPSITNINDMSAIEWTALASASSSKVALEVARNRLEDLSRIQGDFGALQSRLETALSISATSREASSAAESRIRDVDVAEESSRLVASQIIQQAGAAILSQANAQPGLLLPLLQQA